MKTIVRSLTILGTISILLLGISQAGGSETILMAQTGESEELKGTEFPFPVGWVPGIEAEDSYDGREAVGTGALPEPVKPVGELKGTEFPFPVGWVPGIEADDSYDGREAVDTGALPETVKPVDELKGTEFPFPVGWVPEEKE